MMMECLHSVWNQSSILTYTRYIVLVKYDPCSFQGFRERSNDSCRKGNYMTYSIKKVFWGGVCRVSSFWLVVWLSHFWLILIGIFLNGMIEIVIVNILYEKRIESGFLDSEWYRVFDLTIKDHIK